MNSVKGMMEIPEVAQLLGIAEGTLRVWRTKKINIPFHRYGKKRIFYREVDVQKFIDDSRVEITHVEAPGGEQ